MLYIVKYNVEKTCKYKYMENVYWNVLEMHTNYKK